MDLLVLLGAITGFVGGLAGLGAFFLQWRVHRSRNPMLSVGQPAALSVFNNYGDEHLQTYVTVSNPSSLPNALSTIILEGLDPRCTVHTVSREHGITDDMLVRTKQGNRADSSRFALGPGDGPSTIRLVFNRPSDSALANARLWWRIRFYDSRGRRVTHHVRVTDPTSGLAHNLRPSRVVVAFWTVVRRAERRWWMVERLAKRAIAR
ncbi:MAG: hypothetical protein GEU80_09810 [Dehalococcoidia bacterium]|nr:hypothetical protein [Dehalococcoidia bacterium]